MKVKVQHDGKEIEVDIDLAAHQLVPASRITEETAKRTAKEVEAANALKELAAIKASSDLYATRLALAGDSVPSERDAKRAMSVYRSDIEGVEKPPTFAEWSAKDGASIVSALRPVAAAPVPAGAPNPAPAPAGAAPSPAAPNIPNTNTGALPASPGTRPTPAQVKAAQTDLLSQRRAAIERGDTKAAEELRVKIQALYATAGAATT